MIEGAWRVIKVSAVIVACALFMTAILTLFSLAETLFFGGVFSEILIIISCCLPFNALAVFGSVGVVCAGALAFLIAKKIFDLSSWGLNSTG